MARESPLEIIGAYHVALFPPWREVAEAQCRRIRESGVLARTSRILVGVVGDLEEDLSPLCRWLGERAEVRYLGPLEMFEFPTLQWLYEEACIGEEQVACWYMHTKAISHLHEAGIGHRHAMEALILDNHVACLDLLNSYDACGGDWTLNGFDQYRPHFSGNFWWANAHYLRRLPPPRALRRSNRYEAEFWIGSDPNIRPFGFCRQSDPFSKPSAWVGLESLYRDLIGDIGPIRRIVDLGVDYGYTTFHFARDFPEAEIIGISTFPLHDDAESWVRSHLNMFPNIRIVKESTAVFGGSFLEPVDLLHIDDDHAYESVARDFNAWQSAIRSGGCVLFHDTQVFPGVRAFFDSLCGSKSEIHHYCGLGCWVKP